MTREENVICKNLTAVDGSCYSCGTRTSDPEYPCSLGCIQIPTYTTPPTEPSEFLEPGSCEWNSLRSERVGKLYFFIMLLVNCGYVIAHHQKSQCSLKINVLTSLHLDVT